MATSSNPRVRAAALDQYYTQRPVARACWVHLNTIARRLGCSLPRSRIIEPSAGAGAFIDTAPSGVVCHAFDIAPAPGRGDIKTLDFLRDSLGALPRPGRGGLCVGVGNPPFGKKASLVLEFMERAWTEARADLVAFIVPVQLRKWSAQRHVDASARLIADVDLPEEAFEFNGKPYAVRCCFQIWAASNVALPASLPDLRLRVAPPTRHPDFVAYQYNRMPGSDALFDNDWDFAVPRQGYCDYTLRVRRAKDCDRRKQWILFKARTPAALRRLVRLDFAALSRKNSTVPGFGKADVVQAYCEAAARATSPAHQTTALRRGNFTRAPRNYPNTLRIRNTDATYTNAGRQVA